jgi:serine/threonine protein kinase
VVLTDFELAKEVKSKEGASLLEDEASTASRVGTKGYMAPEVIYKYVFHSVFYSS